MKREQERESSQRFLSGKELQAKRDSRKDWKIDGQQDASETQCGRHHRPRKTTGREV